MERHTDLRILLLLAMGVMAAFHIGSAMKGYPLYRDQHIGTSVVYLQEGIDLFRPKIIGFNANDVPTPQEFPIWQALTAAVMKFAGTAWFGWGNVVSLLIFFTSVWPVYKLSKLAMGERGAWWTCIIFILQPVVFYLCGVAGTDGLSLAITIWFVYAAESMLRTGGWGWFAASAVLGVICVLSKLPFFMMAGLALGMVLLVRHRNSGLAWGQLVGVGASATAVFLMWTRYTDACIAQAILPQIDLRLSNPFMQRWYFGDLAYRLDPGTWIRAGWRALSTLFGCFLLVIPFIVALIFGKSLTARALLAGAIATTLVFTKLVLIHRHYYTLFSLPVAMLLALTVLCVERQTTASALWRRWCYSGLIGAGLLLSTVQGLMSMEISVAYDSYPRRMAAIVAEQIKPSDKAVIWGGGWGGDILMLARRQGLTVTNMEPLKSANDLSTLRTLGYNRVVLISESPLIWASQKVNPGQGDLPRQTYADQLTELPPDWPVLYRTEDIAILAIGDAR